MASTRFDDLIVLKSAAMPAALLECGVIVNRSEEAELLAEERQQKVVAAVHYAVIAMMSKARLSLRAAPFVGLANRPYPHHSGIATFITAAAYARLTGSSLMMIPEFS